MSAKIVTGRKVRYAVVGGGWISQAAFMPSVAQTGNSEMTALVTGDADKAGALGARYGLETFAYEDYRKALASDLFDAVYLALPNAMHLDYALPALETGHHLLLEKPMAVSSAECAAISAAARASGATLMIAYRLHFEPATLDVIARVRAGEIGEARVFTATFSQPVSPDNHRAKSGFWAGPVADMGPYPINACRNLFADEPIEVSAQGARSPDVESGFDDTVAITLRFPGDRIAQFTVSYGVASVDEYRIVGAKGDIALSPGFGFGKALGGRITVDDEATALAYPNVDQFGGQTRYFSNCVLNGREPEPDGEEGLADVRIVEAVERALATGKPQPLPALKRDKRPDPTQAAMLPPIETPDLVDAAGPGGD